MKTNPIAVLIGALGGIVIGIFGFWMACSAMAPGTFDGTHGRQTAFDLVGGDAVMLLLIVVALLMLVYLAYVFLNKRDDGHVMPMIATAILVGCVIGATLLVNNTITSDGGHPWMTFFLVLISAVLGGGMIALATIAAEKVNQ